MFFPMPPRYPADGPATAGQRPMVAVYRSSVRDRCRAGAASSPGCPRKIACEWLLAFARDQRGMILSAELVLILTLAVLAVLVGLNEFAVAVNTELNDLSNAFGNLSQDYAFTGFNGRDDGGKRKSSVAGTTFRDLPDDCDLNGSCDIVIGAAPFGVGASGEWAATGFGFGW